jgi:uncharacterized protein (TIGR03083 family)
MADVGIVYASIRERVVALARDLSPDQLAVPVAACPAWSVQDVVAHLSGSVVDVNAGRLEGVGSDPWTERQVAERKGRPVGELLDEWELGSPSFEAGLSAIGGVMAALAVADAWNHEQDLRGALGLEFGRDVDAEHISIEGYAGAKSHALATAGVPALKLAAGSHHWLLGDGEPVAEVQAETYELARAVAARRTAEQLRAYRWDADDPEPWVRFLADGAPSQPLPS